MLFTGRKMFNKWGWLQLSRRLRWKSSVHSKFLSSIKRYWNQRKIQVQRTGVLLSNASRNIYLWYKIESRLRNRIHLNINAKCQTVFIHYILFSEYDFKERINADCNPKGNQSNTFEDAKKECKNSKQCQGVLNDTSTNPPSYYLCPEDTTPTFGNDVKSTLFEKKLIGRIFWKFHASIIYQIIVKY